MQAIRQGLLVATNSGRSNLVFRAVLDQITTCTIVYDETKRKAFTS